MITDEVEVLRTELDSHKTDIEIAVDIFDAKLIDLLNFQLVLLSLKAHKLTTYHNQATIKPFTVTTWSVDRAE